jgi:Actinobacteria/chloroflexi VLRF1 release factor
VGHDDRSPPARPAAGGGRWIDVGPDRAPSWLAGFDQVHRVLSTVYEPTRVLVESADGTLAECVPPFPPLSEVGDYPGLAPAILLGHLERERVVGVLLARLGGYAAGVFRGEQLLASKVGARLVHGRSSAGGRSQHRFARRRELEARRALEAAADSAAAVLVPSLPQLESVVLGGDRRAIDALRQDGRLAPLFALASDRFLAVPDPRLAVLRATPAIFRALRVRLLEPSNVRSS